MPAFMAAQAPQRGSLRASAIRYSCLAIEAIFDPVQAYYRSFIEISLRGSSVAVSELVSDTCPESSEAL